MTDANGSKNNASSRRLRRTRLAANQETSKPKTLKAATDKANEAQSSATQKAPSVSRRPRRRRRNHQLPGEPNRTNRATKTISSASASRLNDSPERSTNPAQPSSKQPSAKSKLDPSGKKTTVPKAVSSTHKSAAAGTIKGKRRTPSRATSKPTTAGSVPLSSSLVRRRSRRFKLPKYALSAIWILVGGLGLATIFGTILANRPGGDSDTVLTAAAETAANPIDPFPIPLTQEAPQLKTEIAELPTLFPNLDFKAFYVDVDTGEYVDVNGREAIAAASTIKLPILLAFFEEVDKGNIDLNQTVAMLKEQIADGSGEMELSPVGTQFTALEVATQMIVNSDNTATNMMVDLLGGDEVLNQRFASYGLEETRLNNPLPDIEGTNTTSARDLVHSMLLVQGDTLSTRSRDRVLNILNRTENKRLLAAGLAEKDALTYNKTGFIGKMLGDVALVDLSNGKRYAVSVLVGRPNNDGRALEIIHNISGRTFQHADQAVQTAVTPLSNPEGSTTDDPDSSSSTDDASAADSITITPPQGEQTAPPVDDSELEATEAPYPSANP